MKLQNELNKKYNISVHISKLIESILLKNIVEEIMKLISDNTNAIEALFELIRINILN